MLKAALSVSNFQRKGNDQRVADEELSNGIVNDVSSILSALREKWKALPEEDRKRYIDMETAAAEHKEIISGDAVDC